MVLCFVALFVFGVMSIFSAKYRPLAKDAIRCTFLKMTFRPCDIGLEERMKASIIGSLMTRFPSAATFVHNHYGALSVAFTILFFGSLILTAQGVYSYWAYGNCNGEDSTGFCIFNPGATGDGGYSQISNPNQLVPPISLAGIVLGSTAPSAKVIVIEFGCFSCPYTKKAEPTVQYLLSKYSGKVQFIYKIFPLPSHPFSNEAAIASVCADKLGKYPEYRALLFANQSDFRIGGAKTLLAFAKQVEMNESQFQECIGSKDVADIVNSQRNEGLASKIYGTPTFFINGKPLVGPKPVSEFETMIDEALRK